MEASSNVVIVGAGPFGLSLAAHLKAKRVDYRIFGTPMRSWSDHCPKGMRLKSEGFASDLFAPDDGYPLSQYCAEQGIPYADVGIPVDTKTFVNYGVEFQRRLVPELEDRQVVRLERTGTAFTLWLDNGERVEAAKVVLGTGLGYYTSIPAALRGLPKEVVSHSWHCSGFDSFAGRDVAVIGTGASALDCAATLLNGNAQVSLLTRHAKLKFQSPPDPGRRSLKERIRWPQTGLGPGWKSVLSCEAPGLFHRLPQAARHKMVRRHLGPAPGWFVRDQVEGHIHLHTQVTPVGAEMRGNRVLLQAAGPDGERKMIEADHVVAATGYEIDLRRLPLLAPDLLAALRMEDYKPALSANFESSVAGLYFMGAAAAFSFGPLLRFAFGARFNAERVARHLAPLRAKPRQTWSKAVSPDRAATVEP